MSVSEQPIASARTGTLSAPSWAERVPLLAFLASRLLTLSAGAAGALLVTRARGWSTFDPSRLSSGMGAVGNVLGSVAVRWDSIHYLQIAAHGYATAGQTAFFPAYPILIRGLGWVIRSDAGAGILISAVSFAAGLTLLHRLTELELGRRAADATALLLAFAPLSLFFSAVYTESLFLALSVGAIYAARRDRPALAGALAALATVTRVSGILLIVPIALIELRRPGHERRRLAWLALSPAALGGFLGYLSTRGYGWLAPIHAQTGQAHAHSLAGPIATVLDAVRAGASGLGSTLTGTRPLAPSLGGPFSPGFENLLLLAVLVVAVAALVACWRRLPAAYGAYATLALALAISSPVALEPLKSLDRYTLTIFPLWMAAGAWAAERRAVRGLAMISAGLLVFYAFAFATWAWVA
jgi:Mannosyltransferase (PIG-V)